MTTEKSFCENHRKLINSLIKRIEKAEDEKKVLKDALEYLLEILEDYDIVDRLSATCLESVVHQALKEIKR